MLTSEGYPGFEPMYLNLRDLRLQVSVPRLVKTTPNPLVKAGLSLGWGGVFAIEQRATPQLDGLES